MDQQITEAGAIALFALALYVFTLWNTGNILHAKGYFLLGDRIRSISITAPAFSIGFFIAVMFCITIIGEMGVPFISPDDPAYLLAARTSQILGFLWGVYKGWTDPMRD